MVSVKSVIFKDSACALLYDACKPGQPVPALAIFPSCSPGMQNDLGGSDASSGIVISVS